MEVFQKSSLTASKIYPFVSFQLEDAVKLEVVDCAEVEIRCSFFELVPTGEAFVLLILVKFFIFPLMLLFVELFGFNHFGDY